jgi:type IV secretion system protein VirD4
MVSRQETARPLLTPGEVMQLPPDDELVLVSGCPPIRAKKARYYEDRRLIERVFAPPKPGRSAPGAGGSQDDWSRLPIPISGDGQGGAAAPAIAKAADDSANGGIRREPELPEHEDIVAEQAVKPAPEFAFGEDEGDEDALRARVLRANARTIARQAVMDPGDGMQL